MATPSKKARTTLDLDLTQAKKKLQELTRYAGKQAMRVGSTLRQNVSRGMNAVGLGVGVGTGMAMVRAQTQSGVGDILGEVFGGVSARAEDAILGDAAVNARADKSAREDTIAAFGMVAGTQGAIPPGAKTWFDARKKQTFAEEQGRKMFEMSGDFRTTDPVDVMKKVIDNITGLVKEAFSALGDRIYETLFG